MENESVIDISYLTSGNLHINNDTLSYIGRDITRIPEVFGKLHGSKITHLDLSYNCINNLAGLERFTILSELILDNNELTDAVMFCVIKTLYTLSLNNNKINDLESLIIKIKNNFPNLKFLSLLGNKACPNQLSDVNKDEDDYKRYRCFVLYYLRNLKFLDSTEVTNSELMEAAAKGQFMQIKRPKKTDKIENFMEERVFNYTPLPSTSRSAGEHRGAYGTFKFRYANKESEGNRFILNNDL